jgi:hypothetical protein
MSRKQGRYKTGYDPREHGRQLTICFEPETRLTSSKNYTFLVHPEMKKELDNIFISILGTSEKK